MRTVMARVVVRDVAETSDVVEWMIQEGLISTHGYDIVPCVVQGYSRIIGGWNECDNVAKLVETVKEMQVEFDMMTPVEVNFDDVDRQQVS